MAGIDHVVKAGYWFFRHDLIRQVSEIPSENQFQTFPNTVRERNPRVKALLSIGGPGSDISQVVRDETRRARFIQDSKNLATTFGYNGLDLCWLYPSPLNNGGDLIALLNKWRTDAVNEELLLTAAVFHHPAIPCPDGRSFNYPDISVYLDLINVLAVDFYTPFNSSGETGPVHAFRTRDTDRHHEPTRCGTRGIRDWIDVNIGVNAAQKLVLGLLFYGYEWNLINPNIYEYFAPANPRSNYKDYRTIQQEIVNNDNYQTWYDGDYVATYSHNNEGSWIGYDDETSITKKVTRAIHGNPTNGLLPALRGYFAWDLGGDDDNWTLTTAAYNAANAVNP